MQGRILLPLLLTFLALPASAFTGRNYVEKCSPENLGSLSKNAQETYDRALDAGSCAGFTGGVLNGANLVGQMLIKQNAMKKNFICLPGKVHSTALIEKSVEFIKAKPALLDLPAQAGIFEALTSAHPCIDDKP